MQREVWVVAKQLAFSQTNSNWYLILDVSEACIATIVLDPSSGLPCGLAMVGYFLLLVWTLYVVYILKRSLSESVCCT